ncbi:MAG TPA: PilN domain-containing protein [bacterium]|jgi:Tfp pilus assembly protein PilN
MEITLNLLPPRQLQRRSERRQQRRRVLLGVAVFGLVILLYVGLNARIALIRGQTAALERRIAPLRPLAVQVQQIEAERDALQRRQDALQQLVSAGPRWSVILSTLAAAVPKDLWITSLQFNGNSILIEGKSLNQASAATLVLLMKRTPVIASASLRVIREEQMPTARVFAFQVAGTLRPGGQVP